MQYVIREYAFAHMGGEYSTEYGDWGAITAIFHDATTARAELERLTVWEMRNRLSLYEPYSGIQGASDDFVERINAFCIERCGEPMFVNGSRSADGAPYDMSNADVVELAKLSNLEFYQIFEVPEDGSFVALWLPRQKHYVGKNVGEDVLDMVFQPSIEDFMLEEHEPNHIFFVFPPSWAGTYEDLSDTPSLLRKFVQPHPNMVYDDATQTLSFTGECESCLPYNVSVPDLFALNALLKNPIFEVRKLTVRELMGMQTVLST